MTSYVDTLRMCVGDNDQLRFQIQQYFLGEFIVKRMFLQKMTELTGKNLKVVNLTPGYLP